MRLCLLVLVSQNATAQCNRKMQLGLRLRLTCYVFLERFLQIALYKKDDPPLFHNRICKVCRYKTRLNLVIYHLTAVI